MVEKITISYKEFLSILCDYDEDRFKAEPISTRSFADLVFFSYREEKPALQDEEKETSPFC